MPHVEIIGQFCTLMQVTKTSLSVFESILIFSCKDQGSKLKRRYKLGQVFKTEFFGLITFA